ncbi:MAG: hypothetical protein EG826_02350 [Deltaproteobacteria bacterium]|nr:hypothetical protein [Deltaproteobacteria bacterium]
MFTKGHKNSKNKFLSYAAIAVLVLTLVGYPLIAPIAVVQNIPNQLVSVPFRMLVLVISLMVIIKRFILRDRFPYGIFWIIWWTFWGLYISRMIIDGLLNPAALRLSLGEYLIYAIGMSLIPALALSIKLDDSFLKRALIGIVALGAIASVFNIWLILYRNTELMAISDLIGSRQATDTLNPVGLAHLGVTVAILSMWMLVRAEMRGLMKNSLLIICMLIGAGAALSGASRGPLLVLILSLPLISYLGIENLHGKRLLRLSAIVAVLFFVLGWLLMNIETIVAFRRVQESLFSDNERMKLLTLGYKLFLNSPILGAGTEPLGFYPHNVILESFMLSGIFSGFIFVTITAMSVAAAVKMFFAYPKHSWISLLYFQYLLAAMFSGSLYLSASMWALMVLVVSQSAILRSKKAVLNNSACDPKWRGSVMVKDS